MEIENLKDSGLVCYCMRVDKKTIADSIKKGNITLLSIKDDTKACTGSECQVKNPSGICCSKDIKKLIKIYTKKDDNTFKLI